MLHTTPTAHLDQRPGSLPILRLDGVVDALRWAAENRDPIRNLVIERGSVLVRGLGLSSAAEVGSVFRQLAPAGLLIEKESFAARQAYSEGVYSSSKWPPNQPMCMHHELSYVLQPPTLMMFACLTAPTTGGATAVADSTAVLAVAATAAGRAVRPAGMAAHPQL